MEEAGGAGLKSPEDEQSIRKRDLLSSGWGERIITALVISVLPSIFHDKKSIEVAAPIISGVIVICISLLISWTKDKLYDAKLNNNKKSCEERYRSAIEPLEEMLESAHITEVRANEIREEINNIISERKSEISNLYTQKKQPELYSTIGETLTGLEKTLSNDTKR